MRHSYAQHPTKKMSSLYDRFKFYNLCHVIKHPCIYILNQSDKKSDQPGILGWSFDSVYLHVYLHANANAISRENKFIINNMNIYHCKRNFTTLSSLGLSQDLTAHLNHQCVTMSSKWQSTVIHCLLVPEEMQQDKSISCHSSPIQL